MSYLLANAAGALLPLAVFGLFMILVAFAIWRAFVEMKRRREMMRANAQRMGLTYLQDDDIGLYAMLPDVPVFQRGRARRCYNIIYDAEDEKQSMVLCDYKYTTGGGKNSHTYHLFTCLLRLDPPLDPRVWVWMQQEGFLQRLGEFLGVADIDFADDPDFSRRFRVKPVGASASEDAIRKALTTEVRRHIMSFHVEPVPQVAITPDRLVVLVNQKQTKQVEAIDSLLKFSIGLRETLVKQ